ncbi:MAG: ABC transporter ATP-binding protein [Myxococcaceae bacterium]
MELHIAGLSKRYPGGVQALRDVTLKIPAGMFGLLGPNGAGKSTLMRILATLQEADAGTATLDGIDVLRDKEAVRRVLGYLPQEFGLYPKVTAVELLDHLAQLKGVARSADRRRMVDTLLERTNLADARRRRLGTFSGGMKQRFGIAQALLQDPKLIIVDEPTAGLDPEERVRFHNLLSEIGEQVVVILSTHIVSDVSDLCQRMAVIDQGELLVEGEPAQLARALQGRVWQKLTSRASLADHQSRFQVLSVRLTGGRTLVRILSEQQPDRDSEPVQPEVEDVYFAAIRQHASAPLPAQVG